MIRLVLFGLGAGLVALNAYALHWVPLKPLAEAPELTSQAGMIGLGLLAFSVLFLLPIGLWRRVTAPVGLMQVLAMGLLIGAVTGGTLWLYQDLDFLLIPEPYDKITLYRVEILGGLAGFAMVLSALKALRAPKAAANGKAVADPAPTAQPVNSDRRGSKLQDPSKVTKYVAPEVPNVGWLMQTYLVADWVLLRLFGAALLFMAYMIYNTAEWDLYKIGGMLYGIAPKTVMYVYAVWGAMMLVPIILPRFISRPTTVLGGAGKAAVLVGLAIVILPGLDAAIDLYAPGDYRSALHSGVPGLFKGVTGLAIFSAMAIALFRNLSRTPPVVKDGMGRPTQRFSAEDLRALRSARMDG